MKTKVISQGLTSLRETTKMVTAARNGEDDEDPRIPCGVPSIKWGKASLGHGTRDDVRKLE